MSITLNPFTGQFDIVGTSGGGGGGGTVTSVGFADASTTPIYVITGSPVTTSGTLTQTLATQLANKVFAGPTSGGAAQPTFRSLVAADIPITNNKELFVLSGTNITNQYLDLAHVALNNSVSFLVQGEGTQIEGASYDYSVNYTGGVGSNTRITFLNGLATGGSSALTTGDVVVIQYQY